MLTSVPRVVELEVAKLLRSLLGDAQSLQLGLESSAQALGLPGPATLDDTREHLEILRVHLWKSIIGLVVCVVAALFFGNYIGHYQFSGRAIHGAEASLVTAAPITG